MADNKTQKKKSKAKTGLKKIATAARDTLVQKDNPNSPHLLFQRMNDNMLGNNTTGGSADASPPVVQDEHTETEAKSKKRIKDLLSPAMFERAVWGDEEND